MTRTAELVAWHQTADVRAAALILPGGAVNGHGRYWKFVDIGLRSLARTLAERGEPDGLAVYLLRYRYRGWNGSDADTAVDARWALGEIHRRHGAVPVCAIGNSLGGRAAFRVASEPTVASVVGIAPWLPEDEPVTELAGRRVLVMHGDRDRGDASAAMSLAYAQRARAVVPDLARFELAGEGHLMLRRSADCWALTTEFVVGTVGAQPLSPAIEAAMAAPAPDGLRTTLPIGYGR
ncbi:alpha/beta hydrolase [Rugosimonospora africana]|nr:alpha/beta hydrolase [Rugosimonospora africana]